MSPRQCWILECDELDGISIDDVDGDEITFEEWLCHEKRKKRKSHPCVHDNLMQ